MVKRKKHFVAFEVKHKNLCVLGGLCGKKAFTIIELVVAMALMAAILVASGFIFKTAIDAQRTASATAEIMRNLRGITDQLNADFRGLQPDVPPWIYFVVVQTSPLTDPNQGVRADRIRFVANGDFQSVHQYNSKTVAGNLASICYSPASDPNCLAIDEKGRRAKILTRRLTIFTSDVPLAKLGPAPEPNEYIPHSFAQWKVVDIPKIWAFYLPDVNAFFKAWTATPSGNLGNLATDANVPIYMAKGVDNFTVQISGGYDNTGKLVWWPNNAQVAAGNLVFGGRVRAVKFTFTLYDSKGIIKNGRTFTHIVYLK